MADDVKKKASDNASPLDILDQLLNDMDGGKTRAGKKAASKDAKEAKAQEEAELEKKRLEYEAKLAQQQAIDQQRIEEQRKALELEMATSAANLARKKQSEEKAQEIEQHQKEQDGYEIVQLDHTKI